MQRPSGNEKLSLRCSPPNFATTPGGDCEYALDAANSAAKHLQVIQAELPATSPLARDAGILAKFVRAAQRNLSQQRSEDNPDELLSLATSLKEKLEG